MLLYYFFNLFIYLPIISEKNPRIECVLRVLAPAVFTSMNSSSSKWNHMGCFSRELKSSWISIKDLSSSHISDMLSLTWIKTVFWARLLTSLKHFGLGLFFLSEIKEQYVLSHVWSRTWPVLPWYILLHIKTSFISSFNLWLLCEVSGQWWSIAVLCVLISPGFE